MRLTTSLTVAASLLALAACQPAQTGADGGGGGTDAATPAPAGDALTAEGWGALRIGMTRDEVTAEVGPSATPDAVGAAEPDVCDEYHPERTPAGLYVMLENNVLTRVSISSESDLRTDRGFGIGSTAAEVKAAYGDAADVEPHHYLGPLGEYITVWNGLNPGDAYVEDPAARGIRYETSEGGEVNAILVGGPSIQYVEGCA